ncbi:hypothetical protein KUTeg_005627 [Tegillarca granosa]|uniref:Protein S-acyltransferase n=1 Tax=Tegillarca granosa TaxID=220873 RepID=A0ABQ9FK79_TEGGR|nr:hypothetical protein KUTeg_005627 [Tegillarca granosa]
MAQVQWKFQEFPWRFWKKMGNFIPWLKLLRQTLFYNEFNSLVVVLETIAEPMFWFVDRFAKYLGPIFVTLVVMATTSVVVVFYTCLLPHEIELSYFRTVFHLTFGHWLLINIVFNYLMACFTDPGHPPPDVPEIVSICKRYFFVFCCFMFTGTIYVSCTGYKHFAHHYYGEKADVNQHAPAFHHSDSDIEVEYTDKLFHDAVIIEFVLCTGVALALLLLILWHIRMISVGETNVEVHINKKEKKRLKKKGLIFKNPYHYGFWKNWKMFLGLNNGRI